MAIPEPGWADEGHRLSPLLDTLSAIVVVGNDTTAAALVALGAAQAQAERRRVVIGDLVGDLEPLEATIPRHDLHGLSDSFTYGISLNRIGYPVTEDGNLYIMPSGSEPVATRAIVGHPRWQRLVAGFREVGALLILVAEPGAPGLDLLIAVTDGALLVGDTRLEAPSHVISRARPRGAALPTSPVVRASTASGAAAPDRTGPALVPASAGRSIARPDATPAAVGDARPSSRRTWAIIGIALAAAVVALAGVTATRRFGPQRVESAAAGDLAPAPVAPASISAPAAEPAPPVENPQDSARAAAYAVVIVAANTSAGANDNLRRVGDLPAATAAPSVDGGVLWYKVFVGAFAARANAEALRDSLRASGRAGEIIEPIVVVPFAFLIADGIQRDSVASVRAQYAAQGVTTYPLVQDDGTARLFAGAFASPDEAMHLAPVLRTAGIQPRIVYRTGRPL
jgi:hypothetical protein